jgi:UDP:flavonoid glycosyltransferase YjiC (YdhE family)
MRPVIVAALPLAAHTGPMLAIAEDLHGRGYDVRFLGGSRFAGHAAAAGVPFTALPAEADFDDRRMAQEFPGRADTEPGSQRLEFDLRNVLIEPLGAQRAALQALLRDDPDAVVISDARFLGTWPELLGGPGIRPPVVAIGLTAPTLLSVDTAPFGAALPPDRTPDGRRRNRRANEQIRLALAWTQQRLVDALRPLGAVDHIPFVLDATVRLPDRYLALTVAGFEYPRTDAPPSLEHIGALGAGTADDPAPPWWDALDDERRVVAVLQSATGGERMPLIEPALRALGGEDLHVIAASGVPSTTVEAPANAHVEEALPLGRVLPRCDVVVSDGGYGDVQQALRLGIPVVVAGEGDDGIEVGARVAWTGAGIDLRTARPGPEAIRSAVLQVLAHDSFHDRALELRHEYQSAEPLEAIANAVEDPVAPAPVRARG